METVLISMLFVLVFWGGLVFFLGEAIIFAFKKGQELLLQRMSIFHHHEYYRQGFLTKAGTIFVSSDLRMKLFLVALICVYTGLSVGLMAATESSLSVLQHMLNAIAGLQ